MDHKGYALQLYLQDGHLVDCSFEKWEAFHDLWFDVSYKGDDKEELRNTEAVLKVRCKLHAGAKGIEWSLDRMCDKDTKGNAHLALNSVLNCAGAFFSRLDRWLFAHVEFKKKPFLLQMFGSGGSCLALRRNTWSSSLLWIPCGILKRSVW